MLFPCLIFLFKETLEHDRQGVHLLVRVFIDYEDYERTVLFDIKGEFSGDRFLLACRRIVPLLAEWLRVYPFR